MCTHTHTHMCTHTHMHTPTHKSLQVRVNSLSLTHTHTYTRIHSHTHKSTPHHSHARPHAHARSISRSLRLSLAPFPLSSPYLLAMTCKRFRHRTPSFHSPCHPVSTSCQELSAKESYRGDGSEAKKKKNCKIFWYTAQKNPRLGRMGQTPRAGTGDSVGRFRRYHCSTLMNYNSNLSMCGTFMMTLLPLPDIRVLLPTPKEEKEKKKKEMGTFRTSTAMFCTKN